MCFAWGKLFLVIEGDWFPRENRFARTVHGLDPFLEPGPVAEAKAALGQAEGRVNASNYRDFDAAREAREAAEKTRDAAQEKLDFYYSGAFYFSFLYSPIQAVETDADGKFAIQVPKTGSFVIAAKAERYITQINSKFITEHYYWLQPISLNGEQQGVQNLSNKNLTSTTGSSSLIHTQDFLAF
jgi:hypothetical protein